MLKNEYLIAKFGLDTAENEPIGKSDDGSAHAMAARTDAVRLTYFAGWGLAEQVAPRKTHYFPQDSLLVHFSST